MFLFVCEECVLTSKQEEDEITQPYNSDVRVYGRGLLSISDFYCCIPSTWRCKHSHQNRGPSRKCKWKKKIVMLLHRTLALLHWRSLPGRSPAPPAGG